MEKRKISVTAGGKAAGHEHFPHSRARPVQDSAITEIEKAWKDGFRYVFFEAPTGSGKSAIAITLARRSGSAYILVSTKTLQDQYSREGAYGTIEVKGRGNFRCMLSRGYYCDVGPCRTGTMCRHRPVPRPEKGGKGLVKVTETERGELMIKAGEKICSYWKQKCDGLNHGYPVMNYSYFLHETSYAKDFGKRKLMVCDEAHNMEDELMRYVGFTISNRDLGLIHCRVPGKDFPVGEWIEMIGEWKGKFEQELGLTMKKIRTLRGPRAVDMTKKVNRLAEKLEKCEFMAEELSSNPSNWIIESGGSEDFRKVSFKPIMVSRWGNKFFGKAERFLLQSATILDAEAMAECLGLPGKDCVFIRAGSDFGAEKRPVYYSPVGSMSHRNIKETLPRLADEIRSLMARYPDKKGVIHTHTYRIQEFIMENVGSKRFIANRAEEPAKRNEIMRNFIRSREPAILVTPSAYEGMDFRDDVCRWQVICKIPYPDLGDSQVKRRMEMNRSWYAWKTVLRLIQTYGRGMRSKDDWCDTYVLDSSFGMLLEKNRDMFPDWFTDAIRRE